MTSTTKIAALALFGGLGLVGCADDTSGTTATSAATNTSETGTTTGTTTGTSTKGTTETGCTQYGPDNTWEHACIEDVPSDLAGTGFSNGDTAYNFTYIDQFGDEVELYQFYGAVIVVDVFAFW